MNARAANRGFTLVEAVAAMVVLSLAVPAALLTLNDASQARRDAVMRIRAAWLAEALLETCVADAAAVNSATGFDAMSNAAAYAASLAQRVQPAYGDFYGDFGVSWRIDAVPAVIDHAGAGSAQSVRVIEAPGLNDPEYRNIKVVVEWATSRGDNVALEIAAVVARP